MQRHLAVAILMLAVGAGLGLVPETAAGASNFQVQFSQGSGPSGLQVSVTPPKSGESLTSLVQIMILLTALSLAPAFLILCTSFTRILIVLSFLRQALGLAHLPPNQVLVGMALFLTAFNMQPVWQDIQTHALQPYTQGKLSWQAAGEKGLAPLRYFMLKQTRPKDLALFVKLSRQPGIHSPAEVPMLVLIPAFVISELRIAFQIGFILYLPFLVIDMVVASILLSMGMMMLPPVMISLPFKVLLFVMIDGWNLVAQSLLRSFR